LATLFPTSPAARRRATGPPSTSGSATAGVCSFRTRLNSRRFARPRSWQIGRLALNQVRVVHAAQRQGRDAVRGPRGLAQHLAQGHRGPLREWHHHRLPHHCRCGPHDFDQVRHARPRQPGRPVAPVDDPRRFHHRPGQEAQAAAELPLMRRPTWTKSAAS